MHKLITLKMINPDTECSKASEPIDSLSKSSHLLGITSSLMHSDCNPWVFVCWQDSGPVQPQ